MIEENIKKEIIRRLHAAEKEHDVKILYACESGSRAWGFASPDSDYDVRFIYARPAEWYLSFDVERKRDVIEYPIVDEIDCAGWDIKKAMYLFTRTNGALLEWLKSPIKYIDNGDLAEKLLEVEPRAVNFTALCYHYSHMARGNAKEYLFKDGQVKLKKYFYVLRPLFAIKYIEELKQPPPIEFGKLVAAVAPKDLIPYIEALLEVKRKSMETAYGEPIKEINQFIQTELDRHGDTFTGQGRPDLLDKQWLRDELNLIFRSSLR